jgi:hypothetical protein
MVRGVAPHQPDHVLQHQQQAEGHQQLVLLRPAVERPDQRRLDREPDQRHRDRAEQQENEQRRRRQHARRGAHRPGGDIGAQRVEAAVRHVDDRHHPEDEAQARGDEEQHRGVGQRIQDLQREDFHRLLVVARLPGQGGVRRPLPRTGSNNENQRVTLSLVARSS